MGMSSLSETDEMSPVRTRFPASDIDISVRMLIIRVSCVNASESALKYMVGTPDLIATFSMNADLPHPGPAQTSANCPLRKLVPFSSSALNTTGSGLPALPLMLIDCDGV